MCRRWFAFASVCLLWSLPSAHAGDKGWTDLFDNNMAAFKGPHGEWKEVADVELDPKNPRKFEPKEGKGAYYNGAKGRTNNLFTKEKFGDLEVHLEFNMPKSSNSGIKFHGHYEIQICDSFGKAKIDGSDCGGIYPRALAKPRYHHIDKGVPPLVNACKEPGQWQTLDATFLAPRFDKAGKKIVNAKLVRVVLNGKTVHENLELLTPTGDRWNNPEMAQGHIMIQADHGPVAFRNVKIRVPAK